MALSVSVTNVFTSLIYPPDQSNDADKRQKKPFSKGRIVSVCVFVLVRLLFLQMPKAPYLGFSGSS